MTHNKFWLVWSSEIHNTSYKYEALKSAKAEAIRLTKELNKEIYVLEATHSFQADVDIIEISFEVTPEESLAVEPIPTETPKHKFKVGDKVKYVNKDVKLVLEHPIEIGTIYDIRINKHGLEKIYVKKQNTYCDFFNKEDLTLAE